MERTGKLPTQTGKEAKRDAMGACGYTEQLAEIRAARLRIQNEFKIERLKKYIIACVDTYMGINVTRATTQDGKFLINDVCIVLGLSLSLEDAQDILRSPVKDGVLYLIDDHLTRIGLSNHDVELLEDNAFGSDEMNVNWVQMYRFTITRPIDYRPKSPDYSPTSPSYTPEASPAYSPTSPNYMPEATANEHTSDVFVTENE
jgi:hypothetical protein